VGRTSPPLALAPKGADLGRKGGDTLTAKNRTWRLARFRVEDDASRDTNALGERAEEAVMGAWGSEIAAARGFRSLGLGIRRTILVLAALAAGQAAQAQGLGSKDQLVKEALSLRLVASAPMQRQIALLEDLYRNDPLGATPSGQATLRSAARAWAFSAAQTAANADPDRPVAMWVSAPAHRWFGLDVPRAGSMVDHPDNVYRSIPIDGAARYEIRGKITRPGPAQETYTLYGPEPGSTSASAMHMTPSAFLNLEQVAVAADGSFTLTIDSEPAGRRPNHLQSRKDLRSKPLMIRDTLSDWATQTPVALEVRRLDGPPLRPPAPEAELAARAAGILATAAPYWLKREAETNLAKPVNTLPTPSMRTDGPPGWGLITSGHFNLGADEALVVTIEPLGAAALGFALSDPWGPLLDYVDRSGSLNHHQARADPDGAYTYVIAATDPGAYNWLDTSGLSAGKMMIRWTGLAPGVAVAQGAGAVRAVNVVKQQALRDALPPATPLCPAAELKSQLAARAAAWRRRLAD
jgi:hypothetical protein